MAMLNKQRVLPHLSGPHFHDEITVMAAGPVPLVPLKIDHGHIRRMKHRYVNLTTMTTCFVVLTCFDSSLKKQFGSHHFTLWLIS